jgi:inner membrane protein
MKLHLVVVKILAITCAIGALMLGLGQIGDLVGERQQRFREAEQNIAQSQAGRQALLGPVLHTSCVEEWDSISSEGWDKKTVTEHRDFMLSTPPRELAIDAAATMEPRYRGLFKVNTYAARATLQAEFAPLAALRPQREHAGSRLACEPPVLMLAVSDARGIRKAEAKLAGQPLAVVAGTKHGSYAAGFHAVLPEAVRNDEAPLRIELTLELSGTATLAVAPVAGQTRMALAADWPHPSFGGRFLPLTREVRDDRFSARWEVSSLATKAPADFARGTALCEPAPDVDAGTTPRAAAQPAKDNACVETFSVAFIDPVNPYSLSDRAIKYGILFVVLSFVAVGLLEVLRRLQVHPMQYLLVGCAISIFFLLLLSLSEHLAFALSYAIAAAACVALLSFYGRYLLGGWRAGLAFGAGIALLYGVLYVLLQMEQTALVIGSGLLFAVLAAVMVLTRKLDWYALVRTPPRAAVRNSEG